VNWPLSWRVEIRVASFGWVQGCGHVSCAIRRHHHCYDYMPAANKPLHLLRALLREASYLPDAAARGYFRRYIVSRYKAYQPRQNATASFDVQAVERYRHRSFKRRQIAIINERTRPLLRKGQKGLNFLRRANQGEIPSLQKALFFAYGRIGRRKYALLENLLRPDPIMDGGALPKHAEGPSPLQALYFSNKRYLQYFDAPKALNNKTHCQINISDRYSRLRAVLKSQHQKGISIHPLTTSGSDPCLSSERATTSDGGMPRP
jgi:hypothetical protein